MCLGGTYLQPNEIRLIPKGTKISLEAPAGFDKPVTICAFVEANGPKRDGGWPAPLKDDGFKVSEPFDWASGNEKDNLARFYCKEFTVEEPEDELDRFELFAVGDGNKKPYGKLEATSPLTAKVFFEAHPQQFIKKNSVVDVALYAKVPKGKSCDKGTLLSSADGYDVEVGELFEYPEYNKLYGGKGPKFPSTSNGLIGAAEFIISDFTAPSGDSQIYFPGVGDGDGEINLCVQVSTQIDYRGNGKKDIVSRIDTHYAVSVDLTGDFEKFEQTVKIQSTDASDLKDQIQSAVDVTAFLCKKGNKPIEEITFREGEDFRICVQPVVEKDTRLDYSVVKFDEVVCSNKAEIRDVITKKGPDALTLVDKAPDKKGTLGFASVVTNGYLSKNEDSFLCAGKVTLRSKQKPQILPGRALRSEETVAEFLIQRRAEEEAADDENSEGGVFGLGIKIAPPTDEDAAYSAPASVASPVSMFALAVASMAMTLWF
ncbi:unnamed protein product [Pseudo-nitzschia multistriata]|uniref:Uncharacterized protein n=1 Tax=Pseudo-nitzschia multistriata TaxID=183589 RepID=A0A448YX46_9STRA|nr:unnamed protein product [Pseudo-nitzschia multistriata]